MITLVFLAERKEQGVQAFLFAAIFNLGAGILEHKKAPCCMTLDNVFPSPLTFRRGGAGSGGSRKRNVSSLNNTCVYKKKKKTERNSPVQQKRD